VDYSDSQMNMLMRALQVNSCEQRRNFFSEIIKCRRRKQVPWEQTPLVGLFTTEDEYKLLNLRATVTRVRNLMRSKGMYLLDAFRLWDYDKDDDLSSQELYGGLEWLGLTISPGEIQDLVNSIDLDRDGHISFPEFKAAFGNPYSDEDDLFADAEAFNSTGIVVEPKMLGNEAAANVRRELTAGELNGITCTTVVVSSLSEIWTSFGTGTHSQAGIYKADAAVGVLEGSGRKVRIPIGDYCEPSLTMPRRTGRKYLELVDTNTFMSASDRIGPALDQQFPKPLRYHLVWQKTVGQKHLYAWEGIPPDPKFACIGMIATTNDQQPSLDRLRCVPRAYLLAAPKTPEKIWDDLGTGGSPGSIWVGSSLNVWSVVPGHQPPAYGTFFEMKADKFKLDILGEYVEPEDAIQVGDHLSGTASGHTWMKNQISWTNNTTQGENAGCSECKSNHGANGPATNTVDGNLSTYWNANSCAKEQWILYNMNRKTELSGFRYYRKDNQEAPKECVLKCKSGGSWIEVLAFTGTKGDGWSEDYELPTVATSQEFCFVVKSTYAESSWFSGQDKTKGANVNQVQFHGK